MDSFHDQISWTHDPIHNQGVTFLDLCLQLKISDRGYKIQHSMYRKPLNLYLYIPFTSLHPQSVFKSFVSGEIRRINLLNQSDTDKLRHQQYFFRCLRARGYPNHWLSKQGFGQTSTKFKCTDRKVFKSFYLKLQCTSSVSPRFLRAVLHKQRPWLKKLFDTDVRLRLAWQVQRNLFRQFYKQNWRTNPARVE
jgi:hypothetical protein